MVVETPRSPALTYSHCCLPIRFLSGGDWRDPFGSPLEARSPAPRPPSDWTGREGHCATRLHSSHFRRGGQARTPAKAQALVTVSVWK